jgi:serine/threonine protein kinase
MNLFFQDSRLTIRSFLLMALLATVWFQITSLSRVNHKNFVNLLGYCQEEQPFTRMMVFEYAPNGTLYEHLHGK